METKETFLLEVLGPLAPFHRWPTATTRIKISTFFSLSLENGTEKNPASKHHLLRRRRRRRRRRRKEWGTKKAEQT
jgi:hypothetical protein